MISQNYKLKGSYSWKIINEDNSVAVESKDKNNLILNQGLDYPSVYLFADCFTSCCIGYGTLSPLLSDTALQQEAKRSNNYYILFNSCQSYVSSNSFNIQRTFDFTPETETRIYGEIGWSPLNTPGNNLFSKSLTIDREGNIGPIAVNRNQFLRVTYTLSISFSQGSPIVSAPGIFNWDANGISAAQLVGLYGVNSSGNAAIFDSGQKTNEPSNNSLDIFISTGLSTGSFSSFSGFSNCNDYSSISFPQKAISYPYTSGSSTKIYSINYGRGSGVGYVGLFGVGVSGNAPKYNTFVHNLNNKQYKATDYELSVFFNYTWST